MTRKEAVKRMHELKNQGLRNNDALKEYMWLQAEVSAHDHFVHKIRPFSDNEH